ncbi:MAG TPA: DUF1540 domain-containing protein [Desulfotomaculum sp.]|nr:DUF1540 domain-containing protein [Desulfotomaculum sp.]
MEQRIKCLVEECVYNDCRRRICRAPAIEVRASGDRSVYTADGCKCHTFKPRP